MRTAVSVERCLSHTDKHKVVIDQHAREATHKEITKVVEGFSK